MCSNCAGDYENPDEQNAVSDASGHPYEADEQDDVYPGAILRVPQMTSELARKRNLDVYTFPKSANLGRYLFAESRRVRGYEVYLYDEENTYGELTFTSLCVALGPRPDAGGTARAVKAVRDFVLGE
jgi:hypothetical protein